MFVFGGVFVLEAVLAFFCAFFFFAAFFFWCFGLRGGGHFMEGGRGGCFEGEAFAGVGVVDGEDVGVEGEAFVVADFAAVFAVADDGPAFVGEVDADLVFAAGEEFDFEKGAFVDFFERFVVSDGEFAFFGVFGGVDAAGFVFGEMALDAAGGGVGVAFDEGEVGFFGFVPVFLEGDFGFFAAGEDEEAGGVAV